MRHERRGSRDGGSGRLGKRGHAGRSRQGTRFGDIDIGSRRWRRAGTVGVFGSCECIGRRNILALHGLAGCKRLGPQRRVGWHVPRQRGEHERGQRRLRRMRTFGHGAWLGWACRLRPLAASRDVRDGPEACCHQDDEAGEQHAVEPERSGRRRQGQRIGECWQRREVPDTGAGIDECKETGDQPQRAQPHGTAAAGGGRCGGGGYIGISWGWHGHLPTPRAGPTVCPKRHRQCGRVSPRQQEAPRSSPTCRACSCRTWGRSRRRKRHRPAARRHALPGVQSEVAARTVHEATSASGITLGDPHGGVFCILHILCIPCRMNVGIEDMCAHLGA